MFRFAIRDILWLTAVVGLALVWRVENQARQRSLEVLNKNEVIADGAALTGRWEDLEITSNAKVQHFRGKSKAEMGFYDGYWQEWGPDDQPRLAGECRIVRPGELDIDTTGVPGFTAPTKWRYKLQSGKLWMIRGQKPAERPSDFDASNDPNLTLYGLKKVELERNAEHPPPRPPETKPAPPVTDTGKWR